jgi:MoaA/NifB/PqqE/SkfB family radical SAM enzyme
MKSSSSESPPAPARREYFCEEPWTGLFSIETNLDVTFCPCFLQLRIGNLNEASIREVWNAAPLVAIRQSFARGELAPPCVGQLCPVALARDP